MSANLEQQLSAMRRFHESGATQSYAFRKKQLLALKQAIIDYEEEIYTALFSDLKKSKEECWATENGFTMAELNDALANLKHWMERVTINNVPSFFFLEKSIKYQLKK